MQTDRRRFALVNVPNRNIIRLELALSGRHEKARHKRQEIHEVKTAKHPRRPKSRHRPREHRKHQKCRSSMPHLRKAFLPNVVQTHQKPLALGTPRNDVQGNQARGHLWTRI